MNTLTKHLRLFMNTFGILCLVIMLWGGSTTALAAPHGSDVSVTIVADRSQVKEGQNITYTAKMTNHGPDDAYFVDTSFTWPDQLNFVAMTCDQGISPDTPACEYSILKAGETVVSKFVATPNPTGRPHKNHVRVTARVFFETTDTVDPHLRNNADSISTKIIIKVAHH
jgi:uncharacterized repeat protein (TIGR01451 family)